MRTKAKVLIGLAIALVVFTIATNTVYDASDDAGSSAEATPATAAEAGELAAIEPPPLVGEAPTRDAVVVTPKAGGGRAQPIEVEDDPPGDGVLMLVCDESGEPQVGASVWAAETPVVLVGRDNPNTGRREIEVVGTQQTDALDAVRGPRLVGTTDARGSCRVVLAESTSLAATTTRGLISGYESWTDAAALTLVVVRGQRVDGSVSGLDGKSLANAAVHVVTRANADAPALLTTDAYGRYACVVAAPAEYGVAARNGELRSLFTPIHAQPGHQRLAILRLCAAKVLVGEVLDPYGGPCADAAVRAVVHERGGVRQTIDPWLCAYEGTTTTDRDGRYRVDLVGDGEFRVTASHPQFAPTQEQIVSVSAGVTQVRASFRLALWRSMIGEVRWSDGRPIEGAEVSVTLSAHRTTSAPTTAKVKVGANALYEIPHLLPDVSYDVACTPDLSRPHTRIVRSDVPATTQSFSVDAAALRGATLRLRLQAPAGEALPREVRVVIRRGDVRSALNSEEVLPVGQDGVATVIHLEPRAPYSLMVTGGRFAPAYAPPFVAGKDAEVTLPLVRGGRLDISVRLSNGRPARGAKVRVTRYAEPTNRLASGDVQAGQADRRGVVTFPLLTPGKWWIEAGYTLGRERQKPTAVTVEAAGDHQTTITIE